MPLQVPCPCGNTLVVSEGAAGCQVECRCGRKLIAPSLHRGPPVEQAIETLLLAGRLPKETNCLLCGAAIDHKVRCLVVCERAVVEEGRPPFLVRAFAWVALACFGAIVISWKRDEREWGKDRVYDLPLRVCPGCGPRLASAEETTRTLRLVPLYADLLDKYPRAVISAPGA